MIRAKLVALLSDRLLNGYPLDEASAHFWPRYPVPEDDSDGQLFRNAIYTQYFKSRALALILQERIMDLVFFYVAGTGIKDELNANAHTSGVGSINETETYELIRSAEDILDNSLMVKQEAPTFLSIFNIVATTDDAGHCPLNREMILEATFLEADNEYVGIACDMDKTSTDKFDKNRGYGY